MQRSPSAGMSSVHIVRLEFFFDLSNDALVMILFKALFCSPSPVHPPGVIRVMAGLCSQLRQQSG